MHRPPEMTSSSAISSATRTGSCHGSTMTAVPSVDASRPAGVVAQELGRGRRHGVAGEVMLQRPQRVEPERLGEIASAMCSPSTAASDRPSFVNMLSAMPTFTMGLLDRSALR